MPSRVDFLPGTWKGPRHGTNSPAGLFLVLGTVGGTVVLRESLAPLLGASSPMLAFVLPVTICAALGGFWLGILATICALGAGYFFFIEPVHAPTLTSPADLARIGLFTCIGVAISAVSGRMHREVARSREAERIIAERAQASATNAQHFRTLVASRTLGVATFRGDAIVDANPAFLDLLGWSSHEFAELDGKLTWSELTPSEHRGADDLAARQLRTVGYCAPYEKEFFRKDGSRVPALIGGAVVLGRDGRDLTGMFYVVDLSRLRRAEQALRESEARLRLALDAARAGSWAWDVATNHLVWSERNYELYGVDPRCVATVERWIEAIHPDDRARIVDESERMLASGAEHFRLELRVARGAHGIRWIAALGQVHRDERGNVVRAAGLTLDITERRNIEESERAARAEAERVSHLKDEFVATLSHELRTPLTSILGWAQVLSRSPHGGDKPHRGLEVIERNARVLSQIVSDLLDVSRIVTGKIHLDVAPFDLGAVVASATETVRPSAEQKGVALDVSVTPIGEPLLGDDARIEQLLWNLLSNAIKFSPTGGRVEVVVRPQRGRAVIVVRDSGQGIAPEFLPHLFERFRQEDASSSRRYGGLGLGLSIVKHITDLHGGRVVAESAGPGRGATFTVELPLASEGRVMAARLASPEAVRRAG
ncbi:ATP-binding protein [Polyangium jinanense]|uniref:histidine kinase n=1 Tax=Polyangium jinanense TaxID=2829994 RepID=A0A9X3X1W4_9BACT|nr:ATP-binding protein [Polyangium jinanense]MDC3957245.1 PAS domain S-box protein [Polyangium jinanense]MDC3982647.1 PAS domain S-box protein [Polyangium jinanense]